MASILAGCTTNPATGKSQFTALMSPAQENTIGAQEHEKILKQYGLYDNQELRRYIDKIGAKIVADTERPDVEYKFFLLDDPMINAFALPGGYIYLTRGLMALSNTEAEIAAVLGHEAGHITGRHSAERYSRGVATTVGATILSAVIGSSGVSEALGVGTDLYLKSYSRAQENESDSLGIRYLMRAGYDPYGMSGFLSNLQAEKDLDNKINKRQQQLGSAYLSTHPATDERVRRTQIEAGQFPVTGIINRDVYLRKIDGITYGSSAKQGLIRGQSFYHTEIGFAFEVPNGFQLINQPDKVLATAENGTLIVFDIGGNKNQYDALTYLRDVWLQGQDASNVERVKINGMDAATVLTRGRVNGSVRDMRLVTIEWTPTQIVRFQFFMPGAYSRSIDESFKRAAFSFERLSAQARSKIKPYRIKVVQARAGDTVSSMASRMAQDDFKEDRFRVLNGLGANEGVISGRLYKLVVAN